jgi:hypothetical protein
MPQHRARVPKDQGLRLCPRRTAWRVLNLPDPISLAQIRTLEHPTRSDLVTKKRPMFSYENEIRVVYECDVGGERI